MDFSHFNGNDLNGWLSRCQQFFEVNDTPQKVKVKLAAIKFGRKSLTMAPELDQVHSHGDFMA